MKKRVLSLVLALVLGAAVICPTVFGAEAATASLPERELKELINIGVVSNAQGNTAWDAAVTRAQMAELLNGIIGLKLESGEFEQQFTDVTEETAGYYPIMAMVQLGYMSGYKDGSFQPERPITGIEAGKTLIHVLGYKYKAVTSGGYPAGYLTTANELGLSSGVSLGYNDPIQWSGLVRLLSNALDIPIAELSSVGNLERYEINPDVTLLSKYLRLQRARGVVTANDLAGIQASDIAPEGKISIDGVIYTPASPTDRNLLGMRVSYIYRLDDDQQFHGIVSIVDEGTKRLTVQSSQFNRIEGNSVYFEREGNYAEQKVSFDITADIIYNGERAVYSKELFENVKTGSFEFISTKNASYDLVIIRDYRVMIVGTVDQNRKILTDERDSSQKICLDDAEKTVLIYEASGNAVSFSFISAYDVVTYLDNERYIEAYVGSTAVSGEVVSASAEGDRLYMTIGEETYRVNPYAAKQYRLFKPGDLVKASIDPLGYIANLTLLNKDGLEFMYLLQIQGSDDEFETDIKARFFSVGRGISVHTLRDPLRVNGTSHKNLTVEKLYEIFGDPIEQLVSVKLDEDNRIVQMDWAQDLIDMEEYSDGFCRTHKPLERTLMKDPWSFSRSIYLSNSTQILMIPKDLANADEKDFYVGTVDHLSESQPYLSEAYNRTKNYEIPEVVVVRTDLGSDSAPQFKLETPVVVVKSIIQTMNEDGNVVKRVKVQQGSKETYFDIDRNAPAKCTVLAGTQQERVITANDLGVGDFIRFSKDSSGYIRLLEVYRDQSADEWTGIITFERNGIFPTTIARRTGDYVFVPHWFVEDDPYGVVNLAEKTLDIGGIIVVEQREGRDPSVRSGSSADLEKEDDIVLHIAYGQLIGIIVMKSL